MISSTTSTIKRAGVYARVSTDGHNGMMYLQKSFMVPAAPEKISACEACVYLSRYRGRTNQ